MKIDGIPNDKDRMATKDILAGEETMLKKKVSLRCFTGTFDSTAVDDHHVVDLGFCLSPL